MQEVSRIVAVSILRDCMINKKELSRVLADNTKYNKLKANDKNFAMLLVNECFRHSGQLDAVINKYLSNPNRIPGDVRYVLRVAAAEWFFTDSPVYAVVNNAVEATKFFKKGKLSGLVNAVVRKICKLEKNSIGKEDIEANFPQWLIESWTKQYGKPKAKAIMKNSLKRYPLYINVKSNPEKWEKELEAKTVFTKEKSSYGHLLKCDNNINVPQASGFEDGEWWVQGFESYLPSILFGDVKGKKVLDCCAAPGGKTAQLAIAGANVFAIDNNEKRIERLQENIKRLKLDVEVIKADASAYTSEKDFDAILIDAPCSATGTFRKNPDAIHAKNPQQVKELAALQKRILENMATLLKSGGTLIYSTCSLQKEEGEDKVQEFLKNHKDFELVPIKEEEINDLPYLINKEGMIRVIPSGINADISSGGFFIARFRKK